MRWKTVFTAAVLLASLAVTPAHALEYTVDAPDDNLFGRPTSDTTIYEQEAVNVDPVSYTHLDVYKRQVPYGEYRKAIATILPGHGGIQKVRYEPESEAELTRTLMAVSYTHLDVYKRQV